MTSSLSNLLVTHPRLFELNNSYEGLPERFYAPCAATPVAAPHLILFNTKLADELGMSAEESGKEMYADIFSGNMLLEGSSPIAMAYAGHQFGNFVPQLGDGRALLIGEVIDTHGIRRDIQLKGSGPTPFSRDGDGRAALGPVIREYIVSEAMHALGIRTTRSLAAVTTGEVVRRETLLPGAILTRVAASHIRIGTFEYFAMRNDQEAVRILADYTIDRHYPDVRMSRNPYIGLLEAVMEAHAALVASWMHVGFIHGVMNTDNMSISGETIDYGPCAFIDNYDPQAVFSFIDRHGRYAFSNQPQIAQWNLARLAETLLPLFDADIQKAIHIAGELIVAFPKRFHKYWLAGMRKKLGLITVEKEDQALIEELLKQMHDNSADFTLTFRRLYHALKNDTMASDIIPSAQFADWVKRWHDRLNGQPQSRQEILETMRKVNPAYIPRNHRIEEAIREAASNDFAPMHRLMAALSDPYNDHEEFTAYANPPTESERVELTFCGT